MTTQSTDEEKADVLEQEGQELSPKETSEAQEIDWTVKGPELATRLEQVEHQLSSERGQSKKVQTQDDRLNRMEDQLSANGKVMSRYLDYISRDDPELARIRAEESAADFRTEATTAFEARHNRIAGELVEIVKDGEDMKITEVQATNLERLWDTATAEAKKYGDTSYLVEVKIQAERMVSEADRERSKVEVREAKENAKKTVQREKEKAGIYDQDAGSSIPAGGEQLTTRERMARAIEANDGKITTS